MSSTATATYGSKRSHRLKFDISHIAVVHTYLAFAAFLSALFFGCVLHYKKIVKNGVAGYPEEWFPSVSATIGDWYPERNIFQILIALTSGPRFALVFGQYYLTRSPHSVLPTVVFVTGIVRTLSCGGWVYITSNDDHDAHDILMITYIVSNFPWMIGGIAITPVANSNARQRRRLIATAFFTSIIPMIYFFVQHKVYRIPGAYTRYSFFEWALIFFDILYDSVNETDFKDSGLQITLGPSFEKSGHTSEIIVSEDTSKEFELVRSEPSASPVAESHASDAKRGLSPEGTIDTWSATFRLQIPAGWRPAISFASDVYLSYIFWSIFTSLMPTMFYFSVWELAIAGSELSLISTLSPIMLSFPPLLSWARTRGGQAVLHMFSFIGLAAYVLDKPLHRLFLVSFATSATVMAQVAKWSVNNVGTVGYEAILTGLGLILSSLSKHANHSNNPVWPFVNGDTGGYNKSGLALAFMALYESHARPRLFQPSASKKFASSSHWLPSAIALGSLIFTLHFLVSDSSTLIAWSWTGYSNRRPSGPVPNLHGSLTLVAQCLGLLIPIALTSWASPTRNFLTHPLWFAYGAGSALVMYHYKNWPGYVGGLNTAAFLMSIIPLVWHNAASSGSVGKTYFTAFLVACAFDFATMWTVAYAFVPGGVYLRERTDLVLFVQLAALSLAFEWPRLQKQVLPMTSLPLSIRSYSRTLLAVFSISSVLVTLYRMPTNPPQPFHPGPRIIRAGIWTLHFGIDNEGRDSQRRVRELISDMQLDVVGLLETDLHRVVFGNRDLTRVIAEEMGYYIDIGPGPNAHTWGAALLSKFPIINSTHHLLPSPDGELAPAIEAVLDAYGTEITVVVVHNGQEETPLDRELQSVELARIMAKSYPLPVIFLGYVVTEPKAARPAPYDILITDGRVHDIDSHDWDRWCEFILYRGVYRTAYARVSRGIVTDTELQIGQFVVPRHGAGVTNDTEDGKYLRCYKEELSVDHWFPMEYYDHENSGGHNGHFYHVFFTPLYYKIPEGAVL